MNVYINGQLETLPLATMTLDRIVEWKNFNPAATAVAVNDKLIRRLHWDQTTLNEGDRLSIISAAFGG